MDPGTFVFCPLACTQMAMRDKLMVTWRTGKGIDWGEHSELFHKSVCRFFTPFYEGMLVKILPPDVRAVLEGGGSHADVGCGFGLSCFLLAKAFPKASVEGF